MDVLVVELAPLLERLLLLLSLLLELLHLGLEPAYSQQTDMSSRVQATDGSIHKCSCRIFIFFQGGMLSRYGRTS